MNNEELKRHETERIRVKGYYQAMKDLPGMEHHLKWLEEHEAVLRRQADQYVADPYGRSMYLQSALTYAKVREHILDMFKDDVIPTNK